MTRFVFPLAAAALTAADAPAHFVFARPAADGAVTVVFSENLDPDPDVELGPVAGLKLTARDAAGADAPVPLTAADHALTGRVPGDGRRIAFGTVAYGVMARGGADPFLLVYHPKAVLGPVAGDPIVAAAPAELVPVAAAGRVAFEFRVGGKPAASAEVTVVRPDGSKAKVTTDSAGRTPAEPGPGLVAAFARHVDPTAGEVGGKRYAAVRHYASVVVDVAASYPPLPKAVASHGAAAAGGYVYVYGGNAGKGYHTFDTASVLGTFHRLKLDGGTAWEPLPGGPPLQGLNLVAHGGKVYRVGGMAPRNAPGAPADMFSTADVARFDPAAGTWADAPKLPAGRSSHDVVAVGDTLVVVGGWEQKGKDEKATWHDTAVVLDLSASDPKWEPVPQPFRRRALTAAAVGGKVYVVGGLGPDGDVEKRVDVFDVATKAWAEGPPLPGGDKVGFSPAAANVGGRLVAAALDGDVHRLSADGTAWEKVGTTAKRMVARLVPAGDNAAVLIGGSAGGGHSTGVEAVRVPAVSR